MEDYIWYVIGFFIPIALAGGAGYLFGRFQERLHWNLLIKQGIIPAPHGPVNEVMRGASEVILMVDVDETLNAAIDYRQRYINKQRKEEPIP